MSKPDELLESFGQTIYMVIVSGAISMVFGLFFGIVLTATAPKGVLKNKVVFNILDKLVNIFRSIPFVILLTALIPLTRMVVGTAIGTKGAILPLIFGTVPFFTRQIESALAEVDYGLIEAAESMGNSPWEIILRVYLKESVPGIVRAMQITFISLVGLTAMAGAVGGGGLGDFAIRYGHSRGQTDVTYVTVIIILIMVSLIQEAGVLDAILNFMRKHAQSDVPQRLQPALWSAWSALQSAAVLPQSPSAVRSSASFCAHSKLTVPARQTFWMALDVASAIWFQPTQAV